MAVGGGLDVAVSRHIWIRALKADYNYSALRNLQGNNQSQLRIGAASSSRSGKDNEASATLYDPQGDDYNYGRFESNRLLNLTAATLDA
jgi:hypothetical protein